MEPHRPSTVSPRFLTRCYIAALAVIALLSIASHLVLSEALRANEGSAAIINESGRQRMLSQRIVSLSAALIAGDGSARRPLIDAKSDFQSAHARLVASSRIDFRSLQVGSSGLNDIVLQVCVPL